MDIKYIVQALQAYYRRNRMASRMPLTVEQLLEIMQAADQYRTTDLASEPPTPTPGN